MLWQRNLQSTSFFIAASVLLRTWSRNAAAMRNEVLCKVVAYNRTRVILSQIELGIEAVFWPTEEVSGSPRSVIRFLGAG